EKAIRVEDVEGDDELAEIREQVSVREFHALGKALRTAGEQNDRGVIRMKVRGELPMPTEEGSGDRRKPPRPGDPRAHVVEVNESDPGAGERGGVDPRSR